VRRQFLRVYLGIALVLVLAALATLLVVDREVRRVVDRRQEETLEPLVWRLRRLLLRADESEQRAQVLERLDENAPFAVRLVPAGAVELPEDAREKLAAGELVLVHERVAGRRSEVPIEEKLAAGDSALVHVGEEHLYVYAPFDEDEVLVLVLVPFPGPMPPLRRWRPPPRRLPPMERDLTDSGAVQEEAGPFPRHPLPMGRGWPPRRFSFQVQEFAVPDWPPMGFPLQGTYLLLGTLLLILALIGAAVYLLLRPFERRIFALADVARQFGAGELGTRAADEGRDAIATLARTFNDMAERTEAFIGRQRELLRAVSHELRTPLARLFFLLDDARGAAAAEEKDRYLELIEGSLEELNELVEELLTFVRLDREAEQPVPETLEVGPVLDEVAVVVGDLRSDLEVEVEKSAVEVSAVPRLFRRAVLNLATNAVRHARKRVQLRCAREGEVVKVVVEDDGPGVPVQARQRIFEPFFRLDESRSADSGGVGLGLAIVERIAQLHGGRVEVGESRLGGARFALVLRAATSG
jgi:signal transduction histidine kinase